MPISQSIRVGLSLALGLVATLGSVSLHSEHTIQPIYDASVAAPAGPDTLRHTVETGEPLILSLPDRHDTTRVDRYALIRAPALCGVAGRSLTCARLPDTGSHTIRLRPIGSSPLADTLTVVVRVQ
jgi:hypothetical protein